MNWNLTNETEIIAICILYFVACSWIAALICGPILARKILAAYYDAKLAFLRKSLGDGVLRPVSSKRGQ